MVARTKLTLEKRHGSARVEDTMSETTRKNKLLIKMHSVCVYCKTVQLKVHCCLHTHTVIHLNYMMLVQMSNNAPNTERTNERTLLSASCKAFNDIWYIDHCYCLINHVQLWFRWKKKLIYAYFLQMTVTALHRNNCLFFSLS